MRRNFTPILAAAACSCRKFLVFAADEFVLHERITDYHRDARQRRVTDRERGAINLQNMRLFAEE